MNNVVKGKGSFDLESGTFVPYDSTPCQFANDSLFRAILRKKRNLLDR